MLRVQEAVLSLLAGDIFRHSAIRSRLVIFKTIYYILNLLNFRGVSWVGETQTRHSGSSRRSHIKRTWSSLQALACLSTPRLRQTPRRDSTPCLGRNRVLRPSTRGSPLNAPSSKWPCRCRMATLGTRWTTRQPISYSPRRDRQRTERRSVVRQRASAGNARRESGVGCLRRLHEPVRLCRSPGIADCSGSGTIFPALPKMPMGLSAITGSASAVTRGVYGKRGGVGRPPAACALGSQGGP